MSTVGRSVRTIAVGVLVALVAGLLAVTAASASPAVAPTLVVTTTADGTSTTCAATCTLRAAVATANGVAGGGATVVVPAGTFALTQGHLRLTAPATIKGASATPGSGATTITSATSRVLRVSAAGATVTGVVIANGRAGSSNGGGILVDSGATLDLIDSTVSGGIAGQGGGIFSAGTLRITRSTVSGNTASGRGGGVRSTGEVTLTNATLSGNTGSIGGGLASSGGAQLIHTTVVQNRATGVFGGGVYRIGGSFDIGQSIVAENTGGANPGSGYDGWNGIFTDCVGLVNLSGLTLVTAPWTCFAFGAPLFADPMVDPLADNGGPTLTRALRAGSPAEDPTGGDTTCAVPTDQRGVARPGGPACDLGAFERAAAVELDLRLSSDVSSVGVGAETVPLDAIARSGAGSNAAAGGPVAAALAKIALAKIALAKIALAKIALAKIGTETTPLGTALAKIDLGSLTIRDLALAKIALAKIALAKIPLSDLVLEREGGWAALLGTGVPLQSLTLADVIDRPAVQALTLAELGLGETALAKISVAAAALGSTALAKIALDEDLLAANGATDAQRIQAWCDQLDPICTNLQIDPATPASYDGMTMVTLALADAALAKIALAKIPLAELGIDDAALAKIALAKIALAKIDWTSTALAKIALAKIPLADRSTIVDCAVVDCSDGSLTLGDIAAIPGGLVGEVGDLLSLGSPALDGYSLADLLLGLLDPVEVPWEDLDLSGTLLQPLASPTEPTVRYTTDLTLSGASGVAAVEVVLPPGFAPKAGTATLDGAPIADPVEVLVGSDPLTVSVAFTLPALAAGVHQLAFSAWAGLDTGPALATATATVGSGPTAISAVPATAVVDVGPADPGPAPVGLEEGSLRIGHLAAPGELDTYQFTVTPALAAAGASANILLSNLPADYDLVLFGPPSSPLRGTPNESLMVVRDKAVSLGAGNEVLAPDAQADIPLAAPPGAVLVDVAARRDTADELIETGTLRAGTYLVRVSGYNGASSDLPYGLRLRVTSSGEPAECAAQTFPYPEGGAGVLPASYPQGLNTIFLVNQRRLTARYGPAGAAAILGALERTADQPALGVIGAVVPVDGAPGVDAAYDAWDAERCSIDAANQVVRAIGEAIDPIRAAHPSLSSLVLIGDDALLPFARVADGTVIANERSHAGGFEGNNPLVASLAGGQVLTDDPYTVDRGIRVNDHELFVAQLGLGRLLGSSEEIVGALDTFVANDGLLDPTSALATGYDFLTDGAHAVGDALEAGGLATERLINDTWSRQQLRDALAALGARGVASVNGHFDESRALPAGGNATGDESDLFLTSDVPDEMVGSLLFSMGCHGGLNTSDVQLGGTSVDWAERFAQLGDQWVANTGFGYGDTELVALSERLMAGFADELDSAGTIGAALTHAKQSYLADTAILTPYDEKAVQQVALYGLPMYRLGGATASLDRLAAPASVVEAAIAGPSGAESTQAVTVAPNLHRNDSADGSWYDVGGQTLDVQNRPVQPVTSVDVTRNGETARGALILGLESQDIEGFTPLFFRPTVDLGAHEPRTPTASSAFPSTMSRVATRHRLEGPSQSLLLIPGQFRAGSATSGETGVQRLFTRMDALVLYGPDGPTPTILASSGPVDDDTVRFQVLTDDVATRVYVLFKPVVSSGLTEWTGVDLERQGDQWVGGAPVDGPVEFIVQAVGPGGVAMSNSKAVNFNTTTVVGDGTVQVSPTTAPGASGWYAGPVAVAITGGAGLEYSVDGGPYLPYTGPVVVSGDGVHQIDARDASGGVDAEIVGIDTSAPLVAGTLSPDVGGGWSTTAQTLSLAAVDPGGSGVRSIFYALDAGAPVEVSGSATDVAITANGATEITFWASDQAGNTSSATTLTSRVDRVAPVVTCGAASPQWFSDDVSISCTATDAGGSGLSLSAQAFSLTTAVPAGTETANALTAARFVCDGAGNCVVAGPISGNKVDKLGPTVTITRPTAGPYPVGQVVTAAYGCTDGGSGASTCVGPVASGAAIDTSGSGPSTRTFTVTARDAAGNTTQRTVTYSVTSPSVVPVAVAGGQHTCALQASSTVFCWGLNASGQLGNGSTTNRTAPTLVGGLTGVTAIAAGKDHSCALLVAGTVRCWGSNSSGQLGDGTTTTRLTPTTVAGLSGVTSIVSANNHTCARLADATVRCWGFNAHGEVGDGTTTSRRLPTVVAGLSGVAAVTTASWHSCALLATGTVRCWGANTFGQLGDGTLTTRLTSVAVPGLSNVSQVVGAGSSTCAVTSGAARCWGLNHHGQLGDGTASNRSTPTPVVGLSGVTRLAGGLFHSCALLSTGTVACWGFASFGQLGNGNLTERSTPQTVVGLSGVQSITAGDNHTVARLTAGGFRAWGDNSSGQLGEGSTVAKRSLPVAVNDLD